MKKVISVICITTILLLSLASCGLKMDDLSGTWQGSYTEDGIEYMVQFYISEDGSYEKIVFIPGEKLLVSTERGRAEIDKTDVILWKNETSEKTVFKYMGKKHDVYGGYGVLEDDTCVYIRRLFYKEFSIEFW